jgi:hypothetical protein
MAALGRRQHGAFGAAQIDRAGGSARLARRRVEAGRWIRLDAGVFAHAGAPATWQRQCMAATLGGRSAVISGRTAAALHGFPGFRRGAIEITVPKGSNHRSRLARVRQSDLVERTKVEGIPVVTPAQCVIEVARDRTASQLGRLVEELADRDRRFLGALQDRYVELAHTRWPGIARIRAVLAARGEGEVPAPTALESVLHEVLGRVAGLPPYIAQAPFPWRPHARQRVDVLIPEWGAVIEADGRRWHTRVDDFERDRARDNEAVLHGFRVLRFTWHQLTRRADDVVDALAHLGRLADRSGENDRISTVAA